MMNLLLSFISFVSFALYLSLAFFQSTLYLTQLQVMIQCLAKVYNHQGNVRRRNYAWVEIPAEQTDSGCMYGAQLLDYSYMQYAREFSIRFIFQKNPFPDLGLLVIIFYEPNGNA